ncbi:MAG: RluA family pseudouridine synthase [Clostridia bacterium]|nr:RluA family pseudouridine synthase [Clostridia bacterium]
MKLEYKVTAQDANKTVKNILKDKLNISSRLLIKLKNAQNIFVNSEPKFVNHIVEENDIVTALINFEEIDYIEPEEMNLDIIYEDEYLLVANKPAGIVVHPSSYHLNNTLANGVKYYLNNNKKIRPINRLDRDTSGIVMFAKNEYVQECFQNKADYKKEYLAIINGILDNDKGTINKPIARKPDSIMEREINYEDGQNAITHYDVLERFVEEGYTLVHIELETGRTHQIRVHFKSEGHTLLGDDLYGAPSKLITRQALHAWKISFVHPITNEEVKLEANIPEDIKNVITKLKKAM